MQIRLVEFDCIPTSRQCRSTPLSLFDVVLRMLSNLWIIQRKNFQFSFQWISVDGWVLEHVNKYLRIYK